MKISSKNKKKMHPKKEEISFKEKVLPETVVQKNKKSRSENILYSVKRYSKQTTKKVLLSKSFHTSFKLFVGFLILSSVIYGSYLYFNNSFANDVVVSQSEIISRVSKLVVLPSVAPDKVVRVEDAQILKSQSDFFGNTKDGDYILMYKNLVIVYDLRNNVIVAMKKQDI